MSNNKLWVEKYRPKTVDQYVFQDANLRANVDQWIKEKTIPHLLLSGVQGSGKTTLAFILINAMGLDQSDILIINASDENNVDTMREKIKGFVTSWAMGPFKVVLLEEADAMSHPAQGILRRLMEEFSDTSRFILTCNYDNKIIPAIKSRCQQFHFKSPNKDDILAYLVGILDDENVSFKLPLLHKYIAYAYPDIRKIVNAMQQNCIDGKLTAPQSDAEAGDYKFQLLDLIENDKWQDARKLLCGNVANDEWEGVYRFLYENLDRAPRFAPKDAWEQGIVIIADHLYKDGLVSDREINAAAMLIELGKVP